MKTLTYFIPILIILSISQSSCSKDDNDDIAPAPVVTTLTIDEENGLIQMREEEKLARDVYLFSFDLYGLQIFENISNSEQRHMDKILELLITFDIPDPASSEMGKFNDHEIQELYDNFVSLSSNSLLDALIVGATIEDLDIDDLDDLLEITTHSSISQVYDKLNCGSRNHIRAFVGQIEKNGGTYTPQYISEERYKQIINGSHENCGNH